MLHAACKELTRGGTVREGPHTGVQVQVRSWSMEVHCHIPHA